MPTFTQLTKSRRIPQSRRTRAPHLRKCPQKKAICTRVLMLNPKKPNSAQRRIAKVTIMRTWKRTTAHIPGIGHNLQKHSSVLIRGGRVRDLPGVRYRVIRGVYDLQPVLRRMQGRSKYGVKNFLS